MMTNNNSNKNNIGSMLEVGVALCGSYQIFITCVFIVSTEL